MNINTSYLNLKDSYLFATVAQKVRDYKAAHPDKQVISLGIGDVTLPLPPVCIEAMQKAVAEMGEKETFRGYGEYQGYDFLQRAVVSYYKDKNVTLTDGEVFISDGAKSDVGNILDVFSANNTVLIPDPVYPVYVDTNVMAGRKVLFMQGSVDNNFLPMPDKNVKADVIYLCSPNNPTGAVYNRSQLKAWVDYANENDAVILFDAAYEAFIHDPELPTSIFEIEGSRTCAIEFSSLSKTAGFTGTRCGYTVIPGELMRGGQSVNKLWLRRQTTKFNGVPYIVQRGAEAVFTEAGYAQTRENIRYYMENAKAIAQTLKELEIWFVGGDNSPYIWLRCPRGMSSWEFFDFMLDKANVVGTPGAGFGDMGEGFFRLTAFGDRQNVKTAMKRVKAAISELK